MKQKHRIFSMMLSLCMLASLLSGITLNASAAEPAATVTVNGNVTLSSDKPYYVNGEAAENGELGENECSAYFENGTLHLKEYYGDAIRSSGDLTIEANGYNVIETKSDLAITCLGALTIDGPNRDDDGNRLDELQLSSAESGGIYGNKGITVSGLYSFQVFCADGSGLLSGPGKDIKVSDLHRMFVSCLGDNPAVYSSGGNLELESELLYIGSETSYVVSTGSENVPATLSAGKAISVKAYDEDGIAIYPLSSKVTVGEKEFTEEEKNNSGITFGIDTREGVIISIDTGDKVVEETDGKGKYYTVKYTGKVPEFSFTAKNKENDTVELKYTFVWRSINASMLADVPTDIGEYWVEVYGENKDYSSIYSFRVKIIPGDASDGYKTALEKYITVGNNIISLPEIPSGMVYGTPTECDSGGNNLETAELTNMIISRNQLSVKTESLNKDTYYIKVPVEKASENAKCNYNDYSIMLTLTKANVQLYDLCNGSELAEVMPDSDTIKNTWNNIDGDIGKDIKYIADTSGYQLEGWYTAPNGWGEKIADADGVPAEGKAFENGKTYYAHWVWTKTVVGADKDAYPVPKFIYGYVKTPKTVYTTGLDFTKNELSDSGMGYSWDKESNTLTLSGIQITALDSLLGLVLPDGSTIRFENNEYTSFKNEDGTEVEGQYSETKNSIICKHLAELPTDIYCAGDLTIHNDKAASEMEYELGNYIDAYTGGIRTAGNLNIENGKIFAGRLLAKDDVSLKNVFIESFDYYGNETDETMYKISSDEGSIKISDCSLYVDNINAAKDVSISGDRYYVYVTDSISAMDSININGSGGDSKVSVALGGYNDAQYGGIYTDTITINNADVTTRAIHSSKETTITNSTVNIESLGIMPAVVIGSGSRFENSNVTVSKVQAQNIGIVGLHDLTISGGKTIVTAANGAAMLKAIMVYGEDNDSGLVLNKAEITTPSGGKIEQEQFRFGEDESSPVYRAWFIGDNSSSVIISPVSSRRSSGGGGTTQYTVTFETNGGNKIKSVKVNKNGTLSKPTEPTKEGYTFDGWYSDKACKNAYDFGESVTNSITLYAKWIEKTKEPEQETEPTEPVTSKWENPFGDVKKSDWFYNAVAEVASKGIVAGISDTAYEPNGTLTRAMFITMLHRYAGEPVVNFAMSYTDIGESWYTEAVRWASSTGVVKGVDNSSFSPDDPITREQAAAMLQRYAAFAKESNPLWNETNILSYDDFDSISEWAIPAIQWAAGADVMKGRTDSTINPSENITRAEIAQMLVNYMGAVEKYKVEMNK